MENYTVYVPRLITKKELIACLPPRVRKARGDKGDWIADLSHTFWYW